MKRAVTYVEIDIETCANDYGISPCTAIIPTTGEDKCFNCRKTCQDLANLSAQTTTIRFAKPVEYLDLDINCNPCIDDISFQPATVSLGKDLGQRATISISMRDHKHDDIGAGFDPYHSERSYTPYNQGSFFGKFRARHPYLRGRALRLLRGFQGDALEDFESWNFIIESFDGPNPKGQYAIIAKDVLKLADGDRAQAPVLSGGFLTSTLTDTATTFNVNPSGIGDSDYPSSGLVAIGGKEIVSFTRSGNAFTIIRAQHDTEAVEHSADSRVQLCLQYTAQSPSEIINDLLVNYANCPAEYIDLSAWSLEVASFLGSVYSTIIAEPTSIKKLISELVEQAALSIFWEPIQQKIKLKVLKEILTDANTFNSSNILDKTLSSKEQPEKRISQVWTYFARTNPLSQLDEPESYKSTIITIDADAEIEYNTSVIKKIFSRWIPQGGRTIAGRLNDIQLARFRDPPRKFSFGLFHTESVSLGDGYQLGAYQIQDEFGAETTAPIQITRLSKNESNFSVEAEEVLFSGLEPLDPNDHTIILDSNSFDVNLKTIHDALFPEADENTIVSVYVESGVIIGASSTATYAMQTGTGWNAGTEIKLYVRGRIQGAGGNGGSGSVVNPSDGAAGGDALLVSNALTIDFESSSGQIWAGGGGGGATAELTGGIAGGGGGQGSVSGSAGNSSVAQVGLSQNATAGSTEINGVGARFGSSAGNAGGGGAAGQAGQASTNSNSAFVQAGGAAGIAIDGDSLVTYLNDGSADIRGSQIN